MLRSWTLFYKYSNVKTKVLTWNLDQGGDKLRAVLKNISLPMDFVGVALCQALDHSPTDNTVAVSLLLNDSSCASR